VTNFAVEATAIFSFAVFLKPMSEDLNISRQAISWVAGSRRLASGLTTLVIGRFIDRHGGRVLIPAAAMVAGLGVIGLGWVQSLWQFLLLFTVIGLSGITMPGNLLTSVPVAKWFVRRRGRATAFVAAGFGLGGMSFALIHQTLIDAFGWRTAWVASGVFVIAAVVPLTLLVVRRAPEDIGLLPDGDSVCPEPLAAAGTLESNPMDEAVWTTRDAFRTLSLWKVLVVYMFMAFAMGGFQLHRVAFWEDRGYDRTLIASSFSLDALFFFLAILLSGFLVERWPVRYVGASAMVLLLLGVLLTISLDASWVLFASALLVGVGQGTNAVVQIHIWPTYYGRAFVGTIRGLVFPTTLVGQALGAPYAGFVFDNAGDYLPAFWTTGALVMLSALLLLTAVPPKMKRNLAPEGGG
jgi:MFS family permease